MNGTKLLGAISTLVLLAAFSPLAADPSFQPQPEQADKILVVKSESKLRLLKAGRVHLAALGWM